MGKMNPRVWELSVRTPGGSYPILIGPRLRHRLGELLHGRGYRPLALVVTDSNAGPLYSGDVAQALRAGGFTPRVITVPAGEKHKTLTTVHTLYQAFLEASIDRQTPVLALGGGVVGDMAGFAAATILRGVPFIQVPTTLLAMVDASVGGKTGVDLPQGKNLVGAFKFPDLVVADTETLRTLPQVEVACGMAEVIKHGLIGDASLLEHILRRGIPDPADLVARAVQVKIAVVEEDPFEEGRRAVLNLGHTFAHALERVTDYALLHGQAVALGLVASAHLGVILGRTDPALPNTVRRLLHRARLPQHWRDLPHSGPPPAPADVIAAMGTDKKRAAGRLRFVIPEREGQVTVASDVSRQAVEQALETVL